MACNIFKINKQITVDLQNIFSEQTRKFVVCIYLILHNPMYVNYNKIKNYFR